MSEKSSSAWPVGILIFAALALVVSAFAIGVSFAPADVITKEVPVNVTVEKVVTKEVPVNVTVTIDSNKVSLDYAVDQFLGEVNDRDALQTCDANRYDFDQISVSRLYDNSKVSTDVEHTGNVTTAEFKLRLKYLDSATEDKCYRTFNVVAVTEDGEDTALNITEA